MKNGEGIGLRNAMVAPIGMMMTTLELNVAGQEALVFIQLAQPRQFKVIGLVTTR